MASIQIPVRVLDDNCKTCQCLNLDYTEIFKDGSRMEKEYYCSNVHMCTFIKNRIVRNENAIKEGKDNE